MLSVNDTLPEFSAIAVTGSSEITISHKSLHGKWTILFFYPEDFSFICPTEVTGFNTELDEVKELGGQVIGVSTDSLELHKSWIAELGLRYPLISDDDGQLARKFGVLDPTDERAHRATFIISPECRVEFSMITSRNIGRSVKENMRVLRAIKTGHKCPADYDPLEVS